MENRRRLFAASCAALVATAMASSICTDIMGDFARAFQLSRGEVGAAVSWGAIGAVAVLFVGGALLDFVGIGTTLWLSCLAHVVGLVLVLCARGFWSLAVGWLFLAVASGLVQAAISPLATTMYRDRKTQILNYLHAWWPGGLIIGGLLAFGLGEALKAATAPQRLIDISWQLKMGLVFIPVVLYALLMLGQKFPKTERVQAGVSTGAMFREALRPMFLLLVFCMLLTASIELGPNRWVGLFIQDMIGIRGVLLLVYTSGLMFGLRFLAGPLGRKVSPAGILVASSVLSGLGLLCLSYARSGATVFLAATVFGVGVTYFWPTMLGTTSERFPKGGALVLGIIGASAGLFLGYVTIPGMGKLHDHYTIQALPSEVRQKAVVGGRVDDEAVSKLAEGERKTVEEAKADAARITFRIVAAPAALLVLIFGAILVYDKARGGHKQEVLATGDEAQRL